MLTHDGTYEQRDRSRAGEDATIDDAVGDPLMNLDGGPLPSTDDVLRFGATPNRPQTTPPAGADPLETWATALLDDQRARFIEVAGAQNEGIRNMIDERFAELHDPYKVFVVGFAAGVAAIVLAALLVTGLGVLFMYATSR